MFRKLGLNQILLRGLYVWATFFRRKAAGDEQTIQSFADSAFDIRQNAVANAKNTRAVYILAGMGGDDAAGVIINLRMRLAVIGDRQRYHQGFRGDHREDRC